MYFYGYPRTRANYLNIVKAFPVVVWSAILGVVLSLVVYFLLLRSVYAGGSLRGYGLISDDADGQKVVLKVATSLFEPKGINLFTNKWSTGEIIDG